MNPLDEHIKNKFGNYSPEVPPHIWENIMAEKDRKKPAAFWLNFLDKRTWMVLLLVAVTASGIIIYRNNVSDSTVQPTDIKSQNLNTDKPLSPTAKSNNDISPTPANENAVKENQDKNITEPVTDVDKNNVDAKENNITTPPTNNIAKSPGQKNSKVNSTIAINKEETAEFAPSNNAAKKHIKGSASLKFQNPETESDETEATENNVNSSLTGSLLSLEMIRAKRSFNPSITTINNPHLNIPCPAAEKDAAGNKRYFEIYAGPDYALRSFKDTGNSAYLTKRKESTRFSSAFSAGIRYTRVFNNGMSFRTGFNYSQINEKFKYAQGNIVQVIYIIDGNGDTTGSYTTTGTRYKTTYNKFRTIDIPLTIGYEMGNGRIHANFNAGAIINLYSWQKGDVLDTANHPVNITTGKGSSPYQFKTNVGVGFLGAVSVYYKLNDRLHIFAEPYFRYNFSQANKTDLTLKQKYSTAGLKLGVRIDF